MKAFLAERQNDGMALLQAMYREWPFFQTLLSNMDMVLARATSPSRRAMPSSSPTRRCARRSSRACAAEWQTSIEMLLAVTGQKMLVERNPLLARSIRNRFPYLDPLNHLQVELLKRHRAGDTDESVVHGIHLTINGIAGGLRNSG